MNTPRVPKQHAGTHARQFDRLTHCDDFSTPMNALLALDAGRMGSWSMDVVTGEVVGDRFVANLLGFDYDVQPWRVSRFFEFVDPEDRCRVKDAVEKALSGESAFYDVEFRGNRTAANAPVRWLGARAQVTERDENGSPLRLVGVNWDATEQKVAEEKLAILAAEMDHRVKNAFAVIHALINLGDRASETKQAFITTLRARVDAMATAHTKSARMARTPADAGKILSIREIIDTSLAPWLDSAVNGTKRVKVSCDPDIMIHSRKVSPLAMVLYELSTNATKFGPLSTDSGSIEITVTHTTNNDFSLLWVETSPAPIEKTITVGGFGKTLLAHCAVTLDGKVTQESGPNGLQVTLTMNVS